MNAEEFNQLKKLRTEIEKNKIKAKDKNLKAYNIISDKINLDDNPILPTKVFQSSNGYSSLTNKWVYRPIVYSTIKEQQKKSPQINGWTEQIKKQKLALFTKFNINLKMPQFTSQEYNNFLVDLDPEWSREETEYLWNLMEIYYGNFIIVCDRYSNKYPKRSVEDLKERVFQVMKAIDVNRNNTNSKFINLNYNKNLEITRKLKSEKYQRRPQEMFQIEEKLLNDMKNLEILIKKKKRENRNFKKLMEFSKTEKSEITEQNIDFESKLGNKMEVYKDKCFAYNRGSFMKTNIPTLPPLTNKKLEMALIQLEKPENVLATESNVRK